MRNFLLAVLAACFAAAATAAAPVEGKDYDVIQPAQPTSDPSKVVVTEFFSYQCPHCYHLAQSWSAWAAKQPADVKVERVAVSIGHDVWVPAAQAFYALSAMGKVPAIDDALFRAIHERQLRLDSEAALAQWAGTQGIDKDAFTQAYRSFGVGVKTKRADELSRTHQLPSIPTIVVDGKYMVRVADDPKSRSSGFSDQLAVVDALIAKARSERKKP